MCKLSKARVKCYQVITSSAGVGIPTLYNVERNLESYRKAKQEKKLSLTCSLQDLI